jgi:CHAT domain-containing protein/tetratricopeptide (TPR) repeat protein
MYQKTFSVLICLFLMVPSFAQFLKEGDKVYNQGNYQLARNFYVSYLDSLSIAAPLDSLNFKAIGYVEDTYIALGDLDGVETFYQGIIQKFEYWKKEKPDFYINLKGQLGSIYASYPKFKDKKDYLSELLADAEALLGTEHESYIQIKNIFGSYYTTLGDLEKAEIYLKEVLQYWKTKKPNSKGYGFALNNLALNYLYKAEYEIAELYFRKSLPIIEKEIGRQNDSYAQIANNLAGAYWNMGRYEEAANSLKESLEYRAIKLGKMHPKYLQSLNGLAAVYLKASNHEEAIKIFEELKASLEEIGQTEGSFYTIVINNLASTYNAIGENKKALVLFENSLDLCFKIYGKDHPESAINIINLASTLVDLKEYEQALDLFEQSLEIRLKYSKERSPTISLVHNQMALCFIRMGNAEQALYQLKKAFECNTKDLQLEPKLKDILKKLPEADFLNSVRAVNAFSSLIIIAAELAEEEEYLKAIDIGMNYLNRLKSQQSFETDKIAILSAMAKLSEIALQKLSKMPNATHKAFQLIESNKAMLIADALRAKALLAFGDLPDSLISKEQTLKKQEASLKKQLIEVEEDSLSLSLKKQLTENNLAIREYQELIKKDYPKYYESQYSNQEIDLEQLKKHLDKNSLLLQYYIGKKQLYLISMDHKGTLLFYNIAIKPEKLENLIKEYRLSLSDYEAIIKAPEEAYLKYSQTAYELYEILIRPLEEALKGKKRLLIIPDKALGHIPFEALLQEKAVDYHSGVYHDLNYLLRDYEIYYNYSAKLFLNNLENTHIRKATKGFIAFAASYESSLDEEFFLSTRSPRLKGLRSILQDLPAAKKEVEALQENFKGDFYFEDAANEQNFKEFASDYQVIHLAMHGILDQEYPIRSALAFSENGDTLEDNFLQAYEISHMQLNADLVVLSACETGFGKLQKGEGVLSLARSFMYAGVPSLLVSLWQVNDQSTSVIMKLYYEQLARGTDKVRALQKAKINYLNQIQEVAQHPAFWAAFIQLGDAHPVVIQSKKTNNWWIYTLGIGGILFILGFAFFGRGKSK